MLSDEEVLAICKQLLRRERAARQRRERRRRRAIERVRAVPVEVVPRFPVSRVWLYGSLLTEWWDEESDVDLAVEGDLSFCELLDLWRELGAPLEWEVDVRLLKDLPLAEKVQADGRVLYAAIRGAESESQRFPELIGGAHGAP